MYTAFLVQPTRLVSESFNERTALVIATKVQGEHIKGPVCGC